MTKQKQKEKKKNQPTISMSKKDTTTTMTIFVFLSLPPPFFYCSSILHKANKASKTNNEQSNDQTLQVELSWIEPIIRFSFFITWQFFISFLDLFVFVLSPNPLAHTAP